MVEILVAGVLVKMAGGQEGEKVGNGDCKEDVEAKALFICSTNPELLMEI